VGVIVRVRAVPKKLDKYRSMRDFQATPEPSGAEAAAAELNRFVIQEHHATALHWDLRFERDGVLVSFAVPMGIPPDPKENHLAIHTEDHPLEYLDFEGNIPDGNYGAGDMFIWDRGTYETEKFRDAEVMVTLHGERAKGKYVLFQTNGNQWMIHRMDPPEDPERVPMPEKITPMLASPIDNLPKDDAAYGYEIKWDGVRAIAYVKGGRLRLQSRNLLDITAQYPELREMAEALGSTEAIIDGEIVALNDEGRPDFGVLQHRMGVTKPNDVKRRMRDTPVLYFAFDLLYLHGRTLTERTYRERRELLADLTFDGPYWKTPPYHAGDGQVMLDSSKAQGLEGVVAKRLDSPYVPGRRTAHWLKVKNQRTEEFIIGGWTPGEGNRSNTIGALLLGYYDIDDNPGGLTYVGKVGTGFTEKFLRELLAKLQKLETDDSPFIAGGKPPAGSRFVRPELVGEIVFTEFTHDKNLRHPSFKRLRPDKGPDEVARTEVVQTGPDPDTEPEAEPDVPAVKSGGASPLGVARSTEKGKVEVVIEGRTLQLSNLDKVLYPSTGFTKAQVIDYYVRIAPLLIPHAKDHPMTLLRYPDGAQGKSFYEKQAPSHKPSWVKTSPITSFSEKRTINFVLVNDLPTLTWTANLAALELHPLLSKDGDVFRPASIVFDLDPGAPADLAQCSEVALLLRDLFEALGLQSFPKTSGSKGMQIYVPLNTPVTYDETKPFAQTVAQLLEKQHPKRITSNMSKALRKGKVFIDWSQNDDHKSTVAVYSLRARERPTVSTPLTWDEVAQIAESGDFSDFAFEAADVLKRVEELGDLFAPLLTLEQELPALGG
jgi:bifunctional non-homologous end joining protein LigD